MQTFSEALSQPKVGPRADISLLRKDTADGIHIRMEGLMAKVFRLLWVQIFCDVFGRQEFQRAGPWYMGGWETHTVLFLGHALLCDRGT